MTHEDECTSTRSETKYELVDGSLAASRLDAGLLSLGELGDVAVHRVDDDSDVGSHFVLWCSGGGGGFCCFGFLARLGGFCRGWVVQCGFLRGISAAD